MQVYTGSMGVIGENLAKCQRDHMECNYHTTYMKSLLCNLLVTTDDTAVRKRMRAMYA